MNDPLEQEIQLLPDWSGFWLEREEVGYLEVSDWDERMHQPPPGWVLVDIDVCVEHSSQIFRYVKSDEWGT